MMQIRHVLCLALLALPVTAHAETLGELGSRLGRESSEAYQASRFSELSRDYFARLSRDPDATPTDNETAVTTGWILAIATDASPLCRQMAADLSEFLGSRMAILPPLQELPAADLDGIQNAIVLRESGGGDATVPASFTLRAGEKRIEVLGRDSEGLRDGVVKLVERMGLRQAPFLTRGEQVYRPRLAVRLGTTPWMGKMRDIVFMGYNAAFVSGGELYAFSQSDAIPELKARRTPGAIEALKASVAEAGKYGLKTYAQFGIREKFAKDDPIFQAHPDIRGALTWKADGDYTLCTEHPLVRQYLQESMADVFRAVPDLDGVTIIIGGESFYHCYMRPFGVEKGHTNCARCEALGPDTVVSNLCNGLAEAARKHNPNAEIIAWPYSAGHVWSSDMAQTGFIAKLKPGTAIFTEMEKDEIIPKPEGFTKSLWDYSIDLIGPGERAKQQIDACRKAGIPIYMKSEPDAVFEAPRLPHIPCMDRWLDRAEALAACGASGAWVFSGFHAVYGSSVTEAYKLVWTEPVPDREQVLQQFAARIAGPKAGPRLRTAWKKVSEAIPLSPELPSYYTGPYYLGPAHPMCADPNAKVPDLFKGYYLFLAEMTTSEGLKKHPTYVTSPTGNVPVFGKLYRQMEQLLAEAKHEIDAASADVPERCRVAFDAEASATRWFYHTARAEAHFYESCQLRDRLLALAAQPARTPEETAEAKDLYERWRLVLQDEKANAQEALPVAENDVRLDSYYGGDHSFSHTTDMLRAKLELIENELNVFLPSVAVKCGLST
ncbi:MAG: hypothetical protein RBU21_23425 [FCB group bacterium]|jgi:hypothetical protein|nr:hypothetical protein [FCB group bacterium]